MHGFQSIHEVKKSFKNCLKIIGGYYEPTYDISNFYSDNFDENDLLKNFHKKNDDMSVDFTPIKYEFHTMDDKAPQTFIDKFN